MKKKTKKIARRTQALAKLAPLAIVMSQLLNPGTPWRD